MFLKGMEARLAEELGKQHQELLETVWEQLKGKGFQGCSHLSLDIHWSRWLSTRKLQTKRNPGLYLQEMLSFPDFFFELLNG